MDLIDKVDLLTFDGSYWTIADTIDQLPYWLYDTKKIKYDNIQMPVEAFRIFCRSLGGCAIGKLEITIAVFLEEESYLVVIKPCAQLKSNTAYCYAGDIIVARIKLSN